MKSFNLTNKVFGIAEPAMAELRARKMVGIGYWMVRTDVATIYSIWHLIVMNWPGSWFCWSLVNSFGGTIGVAVVMGLCLQRDWLCKVSPTLNLNAARIPPFTSIPEANKSKNNS